MISQPYPIEKSEIWKNPKKNIKATRWNKAFKSLREPFPKMTIYSDQTIVKTAFFDDSRISS